MVHKRYELQVLYEKVTQCERCPDMVKNRNQPVFGDGDSDAKLLFLGEAPGEIEDRNGIPFSGIAGRLFNNILSASNIKREDVYIFNTCCCRPPGDRLPRLNEINNCSGYLDSVIDIIKPEYIITLGGIASARLVNRGVKEARGRWHKYRGYDVICTYHPELLLHFPETKEECWEDMQMLLNKISNDKARLIDG